MMKRIYLDYAASTPVDKEVLEAMEPYFSTKFGNPGSVHSFGQEAIAAIDRSRETIANAFGVDFRDIIFTSSATEANNLALRGTLRAFKKNNPGAKPRIILSAIEHESILETAKDLESEGVDVLYLPVDQKGIVDIQKLHETLNDQTVLVSVMYANNEIGTIQPIAEIAKAIRNFREENKSHFPLFHADAAQAFQFLDCSPKKIGVDLMTISSHKIYGPKGAGALYVANSRLLNPITTGGGQEYGLRSGTENVPAIVGFAKAFEKILEKREEETKRIAGLREMLKNGIQQAFPDAIMNGGEKTLPNILNIYFTGRKAEDLLTLWDMKGLAASSGSACRSRALEASYVIEALGYSKERATSSIRFSLGRPTTHSEIEQALSIIKGLQ